MASSRPVGFGARLPVASDRPLADQVEARFERLCRLLERGTVVAVVGTGAVVSRGRPTWSAFVRGVVERARDLARRRGDGGGVRRLEAAVAALSTSEPVEADLLTTWADDGMEILSAATDAPAPEFEDLLWRQFGGAPADPPSDQDPLRALLALPTVERFVTTNYDADIERALARSERDCDWAGFGVPATRGGPPTEPPDGLARSFTHEDGFEANLARFALARCGRLNRNMVFHAHGRFDRCAGVIATERQYQDAYLATERSGRFAFTQTVDLLLRSNSLLFVGYGLRDEDLLRPLRILAQHRRAAAGAEAAFALLEDDGSPTTAARHQVLSRRYGVEVLPFSCPSGADAPTRTRALVGALEDVHRRWLAWSSGWRAKPKFRRVEVRARAPEPYVHHAFRLPPPSDRLAVDRLRKDVDLLATKLTVGPPGGVPLTVLGIVGDGGTGKSWLAHELMRAVVDRGAGFEGAFFWSSYYARDRLTGLERLERYVCGDADGSAGVDLRSLRVALRTRRFLVVMDGVERLLELTGDPNVGREADAGVRWFLDIFADDPDGCRSVLILTSRLWPRSLRSAAERTPERVECVPSRRLDADDVRDHRSFALPEGSTEPSRASQICGLLEGHAYGIALASRYLDAEPRSETRWTDLVHALSRVPPDGRLTEMIRLSIRDLERQTGAGAQATLDAASVPLGPVSEEMLEVCFEEAKERLGRAGSAARLSSFADVRDGLLSMSLLLEVEPSDRGDTVRRYVVHPTVRGAVHGARDREGAGEWPNFTLAGYTSASVAVHPGGPAAQRVVLGLYERLAGRAEAAIRADPPDLARARVAVRGLFGVVRSRMEANTAPRWTTSEQYMTYVQRLAELVQRTSPRSWTDGDRSRLADFVDDESTLYADELAWLYNDHGLALCVAGDMPDAYAVWALGYDVNRLVESDPDVQQRVLQSQLHFGHVFIDMGDLDRAASWLQRCEGTNTKVMSPDYSRRIAGYRGVVAHLRGELDSASQLYAYAAPVERAPHGNARAWCVFGLHDAALQIHQRRWDVARRRIDTALALTATEDHPDLEARARLTLGTWFRARKELPRASRLLEGSLRSARALRVYRLEVEVLSEQSRVALALGDNATARRRALESLSCANERGLGLRQTTALIVLGRATVASGEIDLGRAYLVAARELARSQGYGLRLLEVDRALERIGAGRSRAARTVDEA